MTTPANRFVVGPDPQGRSAVLQRGLTNVQSRERLLLERHAVGNRGNPGRQHDRRRPVADTRIWARVFNPCRTDSFAALLEILVFEPG